jgi:hypothetical protein
MEDGNATDGGAVQPREESSPEGETRLEDAPTGQLFAGTVGDRCATCGASLASDQRYCVQCGQRRGKSRFSMASAAAQAAHTQGQASQRPVEPVRRRAPSGAALVAGVATLVLALGVGVEIGRTGNSNSATNQRASTPAVQVIYGPGAGGSGTTAAATPAATPKPTSKAAAAKSAKAAKATVTKVVAAKAATAASKVLGGSAPKQPTVTTGQSCSSGPGCQGGKFTGGFFGQ